MFPRRSIGTNGHSSDSDPTKNVLDLVNAAIARVDDLRESETRHHAEVARLLVERVEGMMKAEANRIDAIRAVDVDAVQKAAAAMATQANNLATQQVQSAEALRTQVSETATLAETRLAAALQPIVKDVADWPTRLAVALQPIVRDVGELQKRAYEAQGQKTQIVETQAKGGSTSNWMGLAVAACVGFLSVLLAVGAVVISVLSHKP
jgi:hypothetical protein